MNMPATASQTVGPYFSIGLSRMNSVDLCTEAMTGEHIEVFGQLFDGNEHSVPDAQLELWQPDNQGRFAGSDPAGARPPAEDFTGFARVPTDERGAFRFHTILPGTVTLLDGTPQAPHIVVLLSMRGLFKHLFTRFYLAGHPDNQNDPILLAIPAERRSTSLRSAYSRELQTFALEHPSSG